MKKKAVFLSILFLSVLVLALFICSFFLIYKDVKAVCLKARHEYQEDCVGSLIKYIESDRNSSRARNSAIWALGQLADKKALLFLYKLSESLPEQKKCSYDNHLCKYEVQKAIKWCEGGNATSWMYRNKDNWR